MSSERSTRSGILFVVSAASATGKTTLVGLAVGRLDGLEQSRSYTSRSARPGEADGVDYNFVSRSEFDQMVERDEFLEWADVFGNRYGTARRDVDARLAAGTDVVLVIDVQGARQVRERAQVVSVFVLPPSFEALEERLRKRSQDPADAIARRLETACDEVTAVDEYDYVVINDDVEVAVRELAAIIEAERARRTRRSSVVGSIVKTFKR